MEGPSLSFAFFYGHVFFIQSQPSVLDPHFLEGINSQFLYMETIRYTGCQRETPSDDQVHAPGHVQGNLMYPVPLVLRDFTKNPDYLFGFRAGDNGNDCPFLSLGRFVGNNGIKLAMGKASLIDREPRAKIIGKKDVFIGMGPLGPRDIVAQFPFVMSL